jgi:hypothetical protein
MFEEIPLKAFEFVCQIYAQRPVLIWITPLRKRIILLQFLNIACHWSYSEVCLTCLLEVCNKYQVKCLLANCYLFQTAQCKFSFVKNLIILGMR